MPWHITGSNGKFWVVLDEINKPIHKKPHATRAEASRHLRALYANVPEASNDKKEVSSIPTAVMGHGPGGLFSKLPSRKPKDDDETVKAKRRASSKKRNSRGGGKRGNIAGLSKHLAKKYGGDPHFFTKCMDAEELQGYPKSIRAAICARAHYLVTGIYPGAHGGDNPNSNEGGETMLEYRGKDDKIMSGLSVFKDAKGRYRWITFSSNAFQDRDGEIVSTKALEDDVDRADGEGDYGTLRWWHVPGIELGDCDFNMLSGRTLIESGTFRDERIGARLKEIAPRLQVSIGFHHPATEPDGDGVFHHIRRFERSLLPAGMASNTLTQFVVKGDDEMASIKEKTEALRALVGDDLADEVIKKAETTEKSADSQGIAYKEGEGEEKPAISKKVIVTRRRVIQKPADDSKGETSGTDVIKKTEVAKKTDEAKPPKLPLKRREEPAEEDVDEDVDEEVVEEEVVAKPKAPAKEVVEEEVVEDEDDEEEPEYEEDDEAEEDEETTYQEDGGEDEGEEESYEEEETEMPEVIGNMSFDEFSGMLATALAKSLQPYLQQQKEFSRRLSGMESAVVTRQKEAKANDALIASIKDENADLKKQLKEANDRIDELMGAQPRATYPYIASQSSDTETDASKMKEMTPSPDEGVMDFITQFAIGKSS